MSKVFFKSKVSGRWVINIPISKNRVLVVSRGRLLRNGQFSNWLPCCFLSEVNAGDSQ